MKYRTPVLVGSHYRYNQEPHWEGIPLLKTYDFHKVMIDRELYIKIETFLGWLNDNPEIPNKQTNKEKIISHGFDTKISFRHRKDK